MRLLHRRKNFILLGISLLLSIYVAIAAIPYSGKIYISEETRNAFSMDNFFGDEIIPEQVMLLEDPIEAFFHRVNIISNAQSQINIATYAMNRGTSTDIIVGALLSAANRGVRVKIITNERIGGMPPSYRRVLSTHENISVYWYNKFELTKPHYLNSFFHDKYITIDNRFMILGGRNMSDRFFNPDCFDGHLTLDLEVLVYNTDTDFAGSIADVNSLFADKLATRHTSLFTARTRREWEEHKAHYIGLYEAYKEGLQSYNFDYASNTVAVNRITLLANSIEGTKRDSVIAYNLMMIGMHSDKIIAQSPYLSMTRRSIEMLGMMTRGRDAILLTNSLASTTNVPAFSNYYINRRFILEATGMTIYEYQDTNSSLHGKAYLFDGRLTAIGSFNLNERSMRSDTETMLVIDSEELLEVMLESFNRFLDLSLQVGNNNRYILCNYVDEAHVSGRKRVLYAAAGQLLRGLRFLF